MKHRSIMMGIRPVVAGTALLLAAGCSLHDLRSVPAHDDGFGVLVMAHGGREEWNEGVLESVRPLQDEYPLEVAFGMADAESLQESIDRLEARGVRRIGVVRLFVSGESFYRRTEQILGLRPGAPPKTEPQRRDQHHAHSMAFWKVDTDAAFALSTQGLAEAPETGGVLADRAAALSSTPEREDVLILAHGPADDAENERWIAEIEERADAVRGRLPFRRVEVDTLREDWPDKRQAAERRIRAFVERAAEEGGRAIVIPFRVYGFGPYSRVLAGLDYIADGRGLIPHPNVTAWIERQVAAMRAASLR